jgi:hypothetical protein
MKRIATVSLIVFVAGVLVGWVAAGEKTVTLEGKVVCARCTLKEKGFDKCQNVLIVGQDDETTQYYMAKNEAIKDFGDVCIATKYVRVTGTVSEKEGRKWIDPTEIAVLEHEG